jgi:hypothetical protein
MSDTPNPPEERPTNTNSYVQTFYQWLLKWYKNITWTATSVWEGLTSPIQTFLQCLHASSTPNNGPIADSNLRKENGELKIDGVVVPIEFADSPSSSDPPPKDGGSWIFICAMVSAALLFIVVRTQLSGKSFDDAFAELVELTKFGFSFLMFLCKPSGS